MRLNEDKSNMEHINMGNLLLHYFSRILVEISSFAFDVMWIFAVTQSAQLRYNNFIYSNVLPK